MCHTYHKPEYSEATLQPLSLGLNRTDVIYFFPIFFESLLFISSMLFGSSSVISESVSFAGSKSLKIFLYSLKSGLSIRKHSRITIANYYSIEFFAAHEEFSLDFQLFELAFQPLESLLSVVLAAEHRDNCPALAGQNPS